MKINLRPGDAPTVERCMDALAEYLREPSQQRLASLMSLLSDYQDRWIAARVKDQERAQAPAENAS